MILCILPHHRQKGHDVQQPTREIKAVIFDFWGVLRRTESNETREELAQGLGMSVLELRRIVFHSEPCHLMELGQITDEERWRRNARRLGLNSPQELAAFRQRFFANDVTDRELAKYVRSLRGRYQTALLSNASRTLATLLETEYGLGDCFDEVMISAFIGVRKPDPAIYDYALTRLRVEPPEAIFIDDHSYNVEAAEALGIHAIQFTTRDALTAELHTLLGE